MGNNFKLTLLLIFSFNFFGCQKSDSLNYLVDTLGKDFLKEKDGIGLSIGIFTNGKSHFYNFGTTQNDKLDLPTSNTKYEIGSITKTFVSFILANAVKEGKVKLEDDIRKYLKGNYPNLEYKGNFIKLVQLSNTTSLLPDWIPEKPSEKGLNSQLIEKNKKKYFSQNKKDFFNALHKVKLDTIPGTKTSHSNAAAQLLAFILEDIYDKPLSELIENYITIPQKMTNTFFLTSSDTGKIAIGYNSNNEKSNFISDEPYFKYAGGLVSSSEDLTKYIKLMLDKNNPVSQISLRKTVDISASDGKIKSLKDDGIANPEIYSSSLNWFKYHPKENFSQVWTDGGTNGFNSYLVLYPQQNTGIILMSNKSDGKIFQALPTIANQISEFLLKYQK